MKVGKESRRLQLYRSARETAAIVASETKKAHPFLPDGLRAPLSWVSYFFLDAVFFVVVFFFAAVFFFATAMINLLERKKGYQGPNVNKSEFPSQP